MSAAVRDFFGREYVPQYSVKIDGIYKNWSIKRGKDARPERVFLNPPLLVEKFD